MQSMPESVLGHALRFLRANLLGLIAIFIALSGIAVALPGKNRIDSGDIKQGQVKTLDLRRGAVTKAKLRRNAVDGTRVRNNTLTDDDIDESTLGLPLGQGVVGEREEADRERRIVIPPAALLPQSPPPAEAPQFGVSAGIQAASFQPSADDEASAILEVPLDRAVGSGIQVRLFWDANGTGNVIWSVKFRTASAGTPLGGGVPAGPDVPATSTAANVMNETSALDIPAGALENGKPLVLVIVRNADAPGDTLPVFARLRLVEIRYTATG